MKSVSSNTTGRFTSTITPEQVQQLYLRYIGGELMREIAPSVGMTMAGIASLFKRKGFATRPRNNERRLWVNDNFFATIDTAEKAYWVGLLATDGNVMPGSRTKKNSSPVISLTLAAMDTKSIDRMLELMGGSMRSFNNHGYPAAACSICSTIMAHDLSELGIVPNKSFTVSLAWEKIPQKYWLDVLYGLLDGDGSYVLFKHHVNITMALASKQLAQEVYNRFPVFNFNAYRIVTGTTMYRVSFGSRVPVTEFITERLKVTYPTMERKEQKMRDILAMYKENPRTIPLQHFTEIEKVRIVQLYLAGHRTKEIQALLGHGSLDAVQGCIKRYKMTHDKTTVKTITA